MRIDATGLRGLDEAKHALVNNISTDELTPGWVCYYYDETLARYCMVGLRGNVVKQDAIKNGGIQLVFNTTEGALALADSRSLRRAALLHKVPYYTTLAGSIAAAQGVKAYAAGDLEVRALQDYFA